MQLAVEVFTGWSTYFLVRRLGVGRTFSTAAGVAFGLCGTYAWLAHAPIRPVALLPLCLLGVERALDAARLRGRRGGWQLLAVALALSILAGFPETPSSTACSWPGGPSCGRPAPGGGLAGAGRQLGAGRHRGSPSPPPSSWPSPTTCPGPRRGPLVGGFANVSLPGPDSTQLVLPYSLGPIFGFHSTTAVDTIAYSGAASAGSSRHRDRRRAGRPARPAVTGPPDRTRGMDRWSVCSAPTGSHPWSTPGDRARSDGHRLLPVRDPTWELAVVILAALGLDDVARARTPGRALVAGWW